MTAYDLALLWAGGFLLVGMLSGIWKYRHIMASEKARAPYYVDIAHRTSLMYAFASVVLALLAERSAWPNIVDSLAVWSAELFFAAAVLSYVVHGVLGDTRHQFARPHRLGSTTVPGGLLRLFTNLLIVPRWAVCWCYYPASLLRSRSEPAFAVMVIALSLPNGRRS